MTKMITTEDFIRRAIVIHGNRYDYSASMYVTSETPVKIICPVHGVFEQTPHSHLKGCGCGRCAYEEVSKKRKSSNLVCGVGINDYDGFVRVDGKTIPSYICWRNMLFRCYDKNSLKKEPSYCDCEVCEDWKMFSNFKKWFDKNYVEGYEMDKDLLFKGNKVYSHDTCCFVPQFVNTLLIGVKNIRGDYPIGIRRVPSGRFIARISYNGKRHHIGTYNTIEEAFSAYKQARESYIKEVAQKYYDEGKITKRVYNALMKYEVEITD